MKNKTANQNKIDSILQSTGITVLQKWNAHCIEKFYNLNFTIRKQEPPPTFPNLTIISQRWWKDFNKINKSHKLVVDPTQMKALGSGQPARQMWVKLVNEVSYHYHYHYYLQLTLVNSCDGLNRHEIQRATTQYASLSSVPATSAGTETDLIDKAITLGLFMMLSIPPVLISTVDAKILLCGTTKQRETSGITHTFTENLGLPFPLILKYTQFVLTQTRRLCSIVLEEYPFLFITTTWGSVCETNLCQVSIKARHEQFAILEQAWDITSDIIITTIIVTIIVIIIINSQAGQQFCSSVMRHVPCKVFKGACTDRVLTLSNHHHWSNTFAGRPFS